MLLVTTMSSHGIKEDAASRKDFRGRKLSQLVDYVVNDIIINRTIRRTKKGEYSLPSCFDYLLNSKLFSSLSSFYFVNMKRFFPEKDLTCHTTRIHSKDCRRRHRICYPSLRQSSPSIDTIITSSRLVTTTMHICA